MKRRKKRAKGRTGKPIPDATSIVESPESGVSVIAESSTAARVAGVVAVGDDDGDAVADTVTSAGV